MTTDAAVAEAPVEETPTLVDQEITPEIDATPVGDADRQVSSDAAPAPEAPDLSSIEAEADAWLKETEGKGSEPPAPGAEQRQGVDPALAQQHLAVHRQNHRARHSRIDSFESELLDQGLPEPYVKRFLKEVKDVLTEEHGEGFQFAGSGSAMQERAYLVQAIADTVPQPIQTKVLESLKPKEGQPNPPIPQVLKAFFDAHGEEREAKGRRDGRKEGFIAGRSQGERTQSSAKSGQSVQGGAGGSMSRAQEDAALLDPTTPMETVTRILDRRNGQ